MNEKSYLIPANAKKSMQIFGYFNTIDLIILISGIGLSFLMLIILPIEQFWIAVLSITPATICAFLVFPVPNYHNIKTVIKNAWNFYTTRQKYIWKGWCFDHGEGNKK